MREEIYLVGGKYKDGSWNKLAKCYEQFWYDEKEAVKFLENIRPTDLRQFNAVYKVMVNIEEVEKVFDGKENYGISN